jgi:hypothetical protein
MNKAKKAGKFFSKLFTIQNLFFFLMALGYAWLIFEKASYMLSITDVNFGHLDTEHHRRALDDFLQLKVPFRDYLYDYGWFFLAIQAPAYLLLGKNYFAYILSAFVYMPVIGVVLSFLIGKIVLKKNYLVLIFLFWLLLFGTNYNYVSVRHLIPELSFTLILLWMIRGRKKPWLAGGLAGIGLITAAEYGLALNLTLVFLILLTAFSDLVGKSRYLIKFFLAEVLVALPFFIWLKLAGGLKNFVEYNRSFIDHFYFYSPCAADKFPRFSDVEAMEKVSKWLVFGLPIEFLQKLNFYLVPLVYLLVLAVVFFRLVKTKKVSRDFLVKAGLSVYGLLIFFRTLDTPCLGYFAYGLVPFFLLVTMLIGQMFRQFKSWKFFKNKMMGLLIILTFSWMVLTETTGNLTAWVTKTEPPQAFDLSGEKTHYPAIGWYLDPELKQAYEEATSFIVNNTSREDFIYSYPWGPYDKLANRRSATIFTNRMQADIAGEDFIIKLRDDLKKNQPKLVAVNIITNLGIVVFGRERTDYPRYYSLKAQDGPVFIKEGNPIEQFILENYQTVFHNQVAVIMAKREQAIQADYQDPVIRQLDIFYQEKIHLERLQLTDQPNQYQVIGDNAIWELILTPAPKAKTVAINLKLDGDFLTKHLSRYFIQVRTFVQGRKTPLRTRQLAHKDWQTIKVFLTSKAEIEKVMIKIEENHGFAWWLHPHSLAIKSLSFY